MTRLRASAIHFVICAFVGAVLLALFWLTWYPAPLFMAVGGLEIFLMLLGIDVVLGPVLTFIVFKQGKKTLKFDLAVIGCVQIAALAYGVFTLLSGRPVYIAALGHKFDLIQASEIGPNQLEGYAGSLPWLGPKLVGIRQAADNKERERMMFSGLAGADYGHYPKYHAPIETMRDEILANAKPIGDLRKQNKAQDSEITAWLATRGSNDQSAVFQGLRARAQDMAVILDAKTAAVIGIAPFKPWD